MSSTCFSRSSLLLHIFPIPGRNAPPAAFHSFSPLRSVRRCGTSFALNPRRNRLSCIRSMSSEASDAEAGTVRSVPVTVAHELLKSGHRYLDVRTVEEFNGGHAVQAINIPYMFKTNSGMSKNPKFLEEVLSTFNKDDEIIIGCLSGKRSLMAAYELSKVGFACVTDVAGGYSAWVQNGLPTEN
ncbi:thiosulfate sulfurtransferase 16, chloroplastic-like isoform X1 [Zingiber officinale]|uniref:thiosulfate sulfurtransferase 16, chloroplastic-like isoform X1 n=1 Tax=Zingiber officinale TaxID=94328 RepID=UPI001C4B9AD2|nr:thiosulfate sulfurtransferase 16, chloroplastic-like isoform X1 [Zingiber officinale]